MSRWSLLRLAALLLASVLLGFVLFTDPGLEQISLEEPPIAIAVPRNLEGWTLSQGEGDLLIVGRTRLNLMVLEVERVTVAPGADLAGEIERRHQSFRQGKQGFAVSFRGEDWRFGGRTLQAYRASFQDRILGLPLRGRVIQHDVYWPYQGGYLRIGMRYPAVASAYVEPTKYMLAASLRQASQEATK